MFAYNSQNKCTLLLTTLLLALVYTTTLAQENYPIPEKSSTHLFYIQHSHNHNTYVYKANILNGIINAEDPVEAYRVVYTEGGIKKPLTAIQKRLAYGMVTTYESENHYSMHLAASKKLIFHLTMVNNTPKAYVTINEHKMYLTHMFIQLKNGGLRAKANYVTFYGTDFYTNTPVTEKVYPEK